MWTAYGHYTPMATRIQWYTSSSANQIAAFASVYSIFLPDGYAMLMRPNKAETAGHMAATARVIWLCACVRY